MSRPSRHVLRWLLWWIALFWLWLLLVGEWNRIELVAAAIVATVAASFAVLVLAITGFELRVPLDVLRAARSVPLMVFVDFGILTYALVRSLVSGRVVRGSFRANSLPARGDDPEAVGRRALVTILAGYSPNAYVVDISRTHNTALVHDLVPFRESEKPA
jgi:hypothetical protein